MGLPNGNREPAMASVEQQYESRLNAMTGTERISRSMAMLSWTRQMIARQIESSDGPLTEECLKWQVALRIYGDDEEMRSWIERKLADVSC